MPLCTPSPSPAQLLARVFAFISSPRCRTCLGRRLRIRLPAEISCPAGCLLQASKTLNSMGVWCLCFAFSLSFWMDLYPFIPVKTLAPLCPFTLHSQEMFNLTKSRTILKNSGCNSDLSQLEFFFYSGISPLKSICFALINCLLAFNKLLIKHLSITFGSSSCAYSIKAIISWLIFTATLI